MSMLSNLLKTHEAVQMTFEPAMHLISIQENI